eukprot:6247_1
MASNRPGAFQTRIDGKAMAEMRINAPVHYFNITSIVNSQYLSSDQQFYICFGGANLFEIDEFTHVDRQQLSVGSLCKVWSDRQGQMIRGKVSKISREGKDEWIQVDYGDNRMCKDLQRFSEDLCVITRDKWYYAKHKSQSEPQKESFLMKLIGPDPNLLTKCGIPCDARTILRIKTVMMYYNKQNTIPDFDVFVEETNLKATDDNFRHHYLHERQRIQNKDKQDIKTLEPGSSTIEDDHKDTDPTLKNERSTCTVILGDQLYPIGRFVRYDAANPGFESLAEEILFNDEANISSQRFNRHLAKAKKILTERFLIMSSTADDIKFGIEQFQSISVSHIICIIIYIEESEYSRAFTLSCLLLQSTDSRADSEIKMKNHCDNFYWFGRYVFEAIEYFG